MSGRPGRTRLVEVLADEAGDAHAALRADIRRLGDLLGETRARQESLDLVELVDRALLVTVNAIAAGLRNTG